MRGRARTRSSARPDGGRHRGATPPLRQRLRTFGRSGAGALAVAGAVLALGLVGAVFSSTTQNPPNVYTAAQLDAYVPTAVTATRTSSTTCLVSWTPVSNPPSGMTYDVTDGSGTTVVTGASGTSATATVPVTAVTPTVKARLGSWVSTASTAASAPCNGWPDAPGSLTLTPSDGAVSATWTAPAANGGTLSSYTATISPAPGSGSATCTASVPTTTCSWSSLTNGLTYTVSVTATSNVGTGPAATATTIPYPSTVMTSSALKLWLDGADSSTILASSGCTGATATTTVGCWKDKSTSANNAAQATGGSQPSLATVTSRSVPSFNGSTSYLSLTPGLLPTGTTASSTFVVLSTTEASPASSGYRTALAWGTAAAGQTRAYQKLASSTLVGVVTHSGTMSAGGSLVTGVTGVLSDTWTSSAYTGFWNGVPGSTVSASTTTGTTAASVGAHIDATSGWQGPIAESIVVQGGLTTAQRRAVEEYLSRKWSVNVTPGQPTGVTATPSTAADGTASVGWSAPTYNGGSAITSYTVAATPSDGSLSTVSLSCASSPCTLTGLVDGALYTVTVAGNNAVGAGPASSGVSLTTYPAGSVMTSSALKLWLDGADAATLFAGTSCSGTAASTTAGCWKDKSSSANDVSQATAGSRPSLTTVNGRSALSFDGTASYLSGNAALLPNGTTTGTLAVASAVTPATSGNGASVVAYGGTANYSQRRILSWGLATADTQGSNTAQTTAWPGSTAQSVTVATWTGGTSYSIWNRGTSGATATDANTTGTHHLWIGAHGASTPVQFWAGNVPEVIGLNGSLTATQRRTVEEYLARKWGGVITPAAPQSVSAAASTTSDGTATVTWSAPSWNGGAAVTGYTVTAVPSDGTLSTVTQSCTSPCTVSGLTNGITYTVSVTATNSVGTGPASSSATVIPYPASIMTTARMRLWLDGADTSTMYQASSCTGSLAVASGDPVGCWTDKSGQTNNATQPSNTGWRPALATQGSRLVPSFDGVNDWYTLTVSKFPSGSTPSSMSFVGRLAAATGYRNVLSWGTLTAGAARAQYLDSGPIKADTYTAGPTASQGSVSNGTFFQATTTYTATTTAVAFNAATATTSSAGTVNSGTASGFAVMGGASGMNYWWAGPLPETIVFTGTVTAAEQRTIDEYLARKWGTTIVPAAPTNVTATPSTTTDGAATVSWTTPSYNGGSAITSYSVTATPADGTAATVTQSCASSPCTVTGLTNGALYTVTMQAVNAAGSSYTATAATTVTPYPAATFSANTLAIWLDGADSSTLFSNTACTTAAGTSAGSAVACWKDKSANARNAVAAANATVGGTLNSRATVAFSGTSQLAAPRPVSGDMTLFAVPRTSQANQGTTSDQWWMGATVFDADNPGGSSDYGMTITGGTAAFGAGATDATAHGAASLNNGAAHVMVGRRVMSSGLLEASSDGRTRGTATGPTTSLTGPTSVYLGKHPNNTTYVGDIGEVVALGTAASRTDERTVVEYLSRKWGFSITPSAPSGVTVTGADSQATVTWTAPWNGYSAITGYTITATPVDGSLSTLTKSCSSSPCTVTGMTNGATYAFTITATNAIGTGPASTAVNASAYPAALFTSADLRVWLDAQFDAALSPAADCSGSGATSGVVGCWKDRSGNGWNAAVPSGGSGAALAANAVNGRTALRFTKTDPDMYQVTASGIGALAGADRSVFAIAASRSTMGTAGTNNSGTIALWDQGWGTGIFAKAYGGTTAVNNYQLDSYDNVSPTPNGNYAITAATTSPTIVSGVFSASGGVLTNALALNGTGTPTTSTISGSWNTSYGNSLVVGADGVNASANYVYPLDGDIGEVLVFDRALSASERRTVEEYLARHWGQTIAPAAPTLSTVTKPAAGQLTATWSAPTGWNGGAAVTSYTATAVASGQTTRTCTTSGTSCTIGSLTAGVTYTVTVAAQNTVGLGANSNALTGTA